MLVKAEFDQPNKPVAMQYKCYGFKGGHILDKKLGGYMANKVWRHSQKGHKARYKANIGRDIMDI